MPQVGAATVRQSDVPFGDLGNEIGQQLPHICAVLTSATSLTAFIVVGGQVWSVLQTDVLVGLVGRGV